MNTVEEIKKGISFGKKSGSIIEVTKAAVEPDAISPRSTASGKYAVWGSDNDRPQKIIDENMQDGASAGALRFKTSAHIGAGIQFYKTRIEKDKEIITPITEQELEDKYPDIAEFNFINDIDNLQQGIVQDFEWWSFYYMQYIPNKSRNKIIQVKWQRAKNVRVGLRDKLDGEIKKFYLSGSWPNPQGKIAEVPAFNKMKPFVSPNAMYRHGLPSVDKDYYPIPYWQSNLKWLAVAQKIPEWINANIENSANIKYHVEIPEEYFIALYPEENYPNGLQDCLLARKTAEEELKQKIDDVLAGQKNVSKIFYTKFAMDPNGDILPGWKINELNNDVKSEAWLSAYGTASAAQGTAHGVNPALQGLILSTGLGTGSASDVREQFNYYMQLNTVIPRQTTLEWFKWVKRFNKWPKDINMGYRNIILQSVNENKSGYNKGNEAKPTTANE